MTSHFCLIGGSDYVFDETSLTFPSTSLAMQEVCISVNITDDEVTEANETFTIGLTLATPDILKGGSTVSITIVDDDGECIVIYYQLLL